MKHWMENHYTIMLGDRIARIRYLYEKPIGYKEMAALFNQWQIPTTNDDERDRWTEQSVKKIFQRYLKLLEITELDIIRVYPNLHEIGIVKI